MPELPAASIERRSADEQFSAGTPLRKAPQRRAEQGRISAQPERGHVVEARIEPPPLAPARAAATSADD